MDDIRGKLVSVVDEVFNLKCDVSALAIKELKKNKKFKNQHNNDRCFILGNGPSLKELDFRSLADEYTFTVNQLSRKPDYAALKTNYHVVSDFSFFDITKDYVFNDEYLEWLRNINSGGIRPQCFFPMQCREYFLNTQLDSELDISYFYAPKVFCNIHKEIDMSKAMYTFPSVVMVCIEIAIYMGFREIYLLGCDCTGIVGFIEQTLKSDVSSYAYEITKESDKKRMRDINSERSMQGMFQGWADIFYYYRKLDIYCNAHDIKLRNCTEHSILDCIEHTSLNDVIMPK